jgi:hypothetical protein
LLKRCDTFFVSALMTLPCYLFMLVYYGFTVV